MDTPSWIYNAAMIWSSIPEHHDRYHRARAVIDSSILDDIKALQARGDVVNTKITRLRQERNDAAVRGESLVLTGPDPLDALLEELRKINADIFASQHKYNMATKDVTHFEGSLQEAWKTEFNEELPQPSTAVEAWDDGNGQTYLQFDTGRIMTSGLYDGILSLISS